jgi:hypothetical protein
VMTIIIVPPPRTGGGLRARIALPLQRPRRNPLDGVDFNLEALRIPTGFPRPSGRTATLMPRFLHPLRSMLVAFSASYHSASWRRHA